MLIGRDAELRALRAMLGNDPTAASGGLVVCGAAGLGKSALLAEAASTTPGFTVLRVRAAEFESRMPFATLHHLLSPRLSHMSTLPTPLRRALEMVFGTRPGDPDRFKVGLGVMELLATTPTLCVVDDAQWLDPASAEALALAARRLPNDTVVMVFGARPSQCPQVLDELPRLHLQPLSPSNTHLLLSSALPIPLDVRVRDQIIAEAHGFPSAIIELAEHVQAPSAHAGGYALPGIVRPRTDLIDEYGKRLKDLPEAARTLVLLAAADPTGGLGLLLRAAHIAGVDASAPAVAVDSGLLELGARVSFARPLIRAAIYHSADTLDRRAAHQALSLAACEQLCPELAAWHRGQCAVAPDDAASRELEQAAPIALSRGGIAAAAAFLGRSAELAPDSPRRFDLILTAAVAKFEAGDLEASAMLAAAARFDADSSAKQARIEALHARIAFARSSRATEANQLLSAARLWDSHEPGAANGAYLAALVAAYMTGDDRAVEHADDEGVRALRIEAVEEDDVPITDHVLPTLALALAGRRADAVPMARRSVAALRKHADEPDRFDPAWAWIVCSLAWDDDALPDITERQLAAIRGTGRIAALPMALTARALAHLHIGELDDAAACVGEAMRLSNSTSALVELAVAAWRGDHLAVEQQCRDFGHSAAAEPDARQLVAFAYARLVAHNGLGNWAGALTAAEEYVDRDEAGFHVFVPPELIEAAVHCGRIDMAQCLTDRLSEHAVAADTPWALGIERRCRALVSQPGRAEDLFLESVQHLRASQTTLQLARTQLLYGEWLRRQGRRRDARVQLSAAFETFSAVGACQFAKRTGRELRLTGTTARTAPSQSGGLTNQERAIAERVAEGKTSKEIAAELALSPRTVDAHLRNIFAKLGIRSRRQVRDALPRPA